MFNVLAARDVNTSAPSGNPFNTSGADEKPKTMEYHRQVLQSKIAENSHQPTYVSPSDNIMSPCTKKLANLKNKHFMKAKPQSLFAKTANKNLEAASEQQPAAEEEKNSEL